MDSLDTIYDAIEAGTVTHEQAADMFMQTMVGQSTGVSRDDMLVKLRTHFASQEALAAQLREYLAMLPAHLRPARGPLQ